MDNEQVSAALLAVAERDPALGEELMKRLRAGLPEVAMPGRASPPGPPLTPETIVLRKGRPVLAVRDDAVQVVIEEAESAVWRERLAGAADALRRPIRGVGRIDVQGHPAYTWLGTGWLVRPDVVVTNRHVAREFARRSGAAFVFRRTTGNQPMSADIDFLAELDRAERRAFVLRDVLHIEDDDGPDLAFLRVAGAELAEPLALAENPPEQAQLVAVIGYPARDSRIPDQDLMDRLFGNVYDRKRLAPGQLIAASGTELRHDCTTLGGNSGSAIVDLKTGAALGIHFAGRFLQANFAVPAAVVLERLEAVLRGATRRAALAAPVPPAKASSSRDLAMQAHVAPINGTLAYTIPIHVTVRVGDPVRSRGDAPLAVAPATPGSHDDVFEDDEQAFEGVPADYLDRKGYVAGFLGDGIDVPLPRVVHDASQVLSFPFDGNPRETVLRYHHFSVVMHRDRRMCFFSAVNIDGNQSRRTKRPGWTRDPRIPKDRQILQECYGNPPRFSRGHMTRREDPAWGTPSDAHRGNADSMHATNAVPQMQVFNAGIWLGLEDYALEHAREDDMKISVFTGPVLRDSDPVRFGVRIPKLFWKVIAFVHDRTGALSATGYSISQEKFLREDEFVFGAHETHQRSLRWIEARAGISFGTLAGFDRYQETEAAEDRPLWDPRDIRWT